MSGNGLLIVDDDLVLLQALPQALQLGMEGVTVETADSAAAALERIAARDYDAIVTDIKMPGMDGLALLAEIRTRRPDTPTLIISGHGENDLVVGALRGGACDFIHKPIDRAYLIAAVRRAMEARNAGRRVREQQLELERHLSELEAIVEMRTRKQRETHKVSESPWSVLERSTGPMEEVVRQIQRVADSPLTVLIQGETGTGKDLVARAIHQLSTRRDKPFVAVDCGAIPDTLIESELFGYEKGAFTGAHERKEGQFQLAEGGTLFLDEIVNLPLPTQAKLLRALQQRYVQPLGSKRAVPVAARITVASNVPLEQEVRLGRFRADVFYRLNEFVITLPPLRARDDIVQLANAFLAEAATELERPCRKISEAAAQVLSHYPWPGNVRELRNVIRRAILLASNVIEPEHLSVLPVAPCPANAPYAESVPGDSSLKEIAGAAAADAEQQAIRLVLQATKGNKSEAARLLRTDYKTLHLKMKQYGINAAQFRETVSGPSHA
jgi:DNA-binding NtrC family response regulator